MKIAGLVAIGFVFASSGAFATDFTAPILDLDGKPVVQCPADKPTCGKELTLSDVATSALLAPDEDARSQPSGDEKSHRFALAMRVRNAKDAVLTAEDITLLKAQIGKLYAPLVVGRAFPMLDPGEAKK